MSTVPSSPHVFNPEPLPLTVQLAREGWFPGAPAHTSMHTIAVDAWTAGRLLCPRCHKKGMAFRPFQLHGNYRVVAVCKCGGQEEV